MDNATKAVIQTRERPPQGVYSRVNIATSEVIGETKQKKGLGSPKSHSDLCSFEIKKKKKNALPTAFYTLLGSSFIHDPLDN